LRIDRAAQEIRHQAAEHDVVVRHREPGVGEMIHRKLRGENTRSRYHARR
jgi:hypothetical protein